MANNRKRRGQRGPSKATLLEDPRIAPEIARCREALRTLLRLAGVSIREVERRTGVTYTYWNNVFSGELGLPFKRLLSFGFALDLEPSELFRLLYPVLPPSPSLGAIQLSQVAGAVQLSQAAGGPVPVTVREPVVLTPSDSQAVRWTRCAERCGYPSVEEWLTAAAEAEVLRQRSAEPGEE